MIPVVNSALLPLPSLTKLGAQYQNSTAEVEGELAALKEYVGGVEDALIEVKRQSILRAGEYEERIEELARKLAAKTREFEATKQEVAKQLLENEQLTGDQQRVAEKLARADQRIEYLERLLQETTKQNALLKAAVKEASDEAKALRTQMVEVIRTHRGPRSQTPAIQRQLATHHHRQVTASGGFVVEFLSALFGSATCQPAKKP